MDTLTLLIFDVVGDPWDGVTAKEIVQQLQAHPHVREIEVLINSVGGDVFDGMTIYNGLVRHPANVRVHVDGAALSVASVIAQAGNERYMSPGSLMMIHNPWSWAWGEAEDLRKQADMLDQVRSNIIDIYEAVSSTERSQIEAWMDEEKWFTAQEAVAAGLADEARDILVLPDEAQNIYDTLPLASDRAAVQQRLKSESRVACRLVGSGSKNKRTFIFNQQRRTDAPPETMDPNDRSFTKRLWNAVLGKSGDAPDDLDVLDEARQVKAKAERVDQLEQELETARNEKAAAEQERDALKAENASLKGEQAESQEEANKQVVLDAVASFKIPKAEEASWIERMTSNPEATKAFLNGLPENAVSPSRQAVEGKEEKGGEANGLARVEKATKVAGQ